MKDNFVSLGLKRPIIQPAFIMRMRMLKRDLKLCQQRQSRMSSGVLLQEDGFPRFFNVMASAKSCKPRVKLLVFKNIRHDVKGSSIT